MTLGGHGTITGDVVIASNSLIAPGNSIGELTVGSLTSEGATFEFELETDGSSDTLNVGNLDLSGTDTLNLIGSVGTPVLTYTLINYTGELTGNFETVNFNGKDLPSNFALNLGSGNNSSITLTVIPEPLSAGLVLIGGLALLARRRRDAA